MFNKKYGSKRPQQQPPATALRLTNTLFPETREPPLWRWELWPPAELYPQHKVSPLPPPELKDRLQVRVPPGYISGCQIKISF